MMARMLKRLLGTITAIVIITCIGAFFGLQSPWFSSAASRWLSDSLERPVEVGQLSLDLYPQPALVLNSLSMVASRNHVGRGNIQNVRLRPGATWIPGGLKGRLEIGSVDVDKLLLYDLIDMATKKDGGGGAWLPFSEISVPVMTIRSDHRSNPVGYRFQADIGPIGGGIGTAVLERLDGHMRMTYSRAEAKSPALLYLVAHDWVPPLGPALHFDKARLTGYLSSKALDIPQVSVEAYEGKLDGHVRLSWNRNWALTGQVSGKGLRMAPVIQYYGGGGFDGLLSANLTVRTQARSPDGLLDAIRVEGPFVIRKAVIDTSRNVSKRLRIETIHAKGMVDRWSFKTEDTLVEAYGGEIRGTTETRWSGRSSITGSVKVKDVNLEPVLDALMQRRPLSGALSGDGRFALNAPTFTDIFRHPDLSANLRVDKGVFFETDLENLKEGQTPFNELKTRVRMKDGQALLSGLDIESDRLSAEGWFKVNRNDQLDGKLSITLQNTISLASVHVGVGGTLDDPSFLPATSSIIGGVIGTGLLGPGWGTALGVRLGQWLDSVTGDESDMERAISEGQSDMTNASTQP